MSSNHHAPRLLLLGHQPCPDWVVPPHSPEEQDVSGKAREKALARCLVWLMAPDVEIGPFLV